MSDTHIRPELLAYLDDELGAESRAEVERHLQTCQECAAELERLLTLRHDLQVTHQALKALLLPGPADERIQKRLTAHQQGGAWWAAVTAPFEIGRQTWRWRALSSYAALAILVLAFIVPIWQTAAMPTHGPRQETLVLGQTTLTPGTQAALRVLVREATTGQPTQGVDVTIKLGKAEQSTLAKTVWQGQTDSYGTAQIAFNVPELAELEASKRAPGLARANLAPSAAQQETQAVLIVEAHSRLGTSQASQPITIRRSYKLYLSSDKPLYQPGQVIHMRTLALAAADRKPAAGQEVEFVVHDAAGNKVFRRTAAASTFGIAFADFTLASEIIQGDYRLEARLGDTVSEKTVQVKPYVLPKFKVTLQAQRAFYRPGEAVRGHLQADYFFGKPAAAAQVTLGGYVRDVDRIQVIELTGQTDEEGHFEFEFAAPSTLVAPSARKAIAYLELEAEVIDQAEHTENGYASIPVTEQAILLDAIPESGVLKPGVENVIYLLASYPDGRPAEATLDVEVNGQISELRTGEYGLGEFRLVAPLGKLELGLSARDAAGMTGEASIPLDTETSAETVLLRTEQAAYRVGDTLKLEVLVADIASDTGASGNLGSIYLDVVKEGQTLATQALPLENGRATLALDLEPSHLGTLEINAYHVLGDGTIARDTRLVVVNEPDEVEIILSADREIYRPGDTARLDLHTQLSGQDVQTALGVGVVDESVYALAEQQPGFEKLYFLLEKELLEPRYEVHGFQLPTLLSPKTETKIRQAQDQSARASWAGLPGTPFTLRLQSLLDKAKEYMQARRARFSQIGDWLARAVIVLPLLLAIVVIWGLRPTGVLGQALGRFGLGLTAVVLTSPISLPLLGAGLWVGGTLFGPLAFAATLLAWLAAWTLLAVYAWQRSDPRAQLVIGICSAYLVMGGLLIFVAEAGANLSAVMIVSIIMGCLLAVAALVTLGLGLSLEGTRTPALSAIALGLLIVPLSFYLAWLPDMHSILVRAMGNPHMYAAAGNLLAGCAGQATPAAPTQKEEMAAAPTQEPAATPAPASEAEPKPGEPAIKTEERPRLRQFFPETLYWLPEAVTDQDGHLSLDVPIADSITTWRLTAIANTQDGRIGATTAGLTVFQDFFIDLDLPLALTVGDEVRVPVAVYNYLSQTQRVRLELEPATWFTMLGENEQELTIAANDIKVAYFSIVAHQHGRGRLTVTAWGSKMSDAVAKEVQVVPDGSEVRESDSARIGQGATLQLQVPGYAVPGTAHVMVKLYPGAAAQAIEGLDALLRMPTGCFEQTSSALYPNVMVLDYLQQTGQLENKPDVAMKAERFIATGYQRLLTFETRGGGFSLFGQPPASPMLTAYGLMEFADMARVYPVDPAVIQRTTRWLLEQQSADGSWDPYQMGYSHFETWKRLANARLPITAYLTWALVEAGHGSDPGVERAQTYLVQHLDQAEDPYVLALVANALAAADPHSSGTQATLARLASVAHVEGDTAVWESQVASYTGAQGHTASLETTALATYALLRMQGGSQVERAQQGLNGLIAAKDSFGTWETTQATVLALKAFLLATQNAGETPVDSTVSVSLDGQTSYPVVFNAENTGVVQTIFFDDITPGAHTLNLEVSEAGGTTSALLYQITNIYYVPWDKAPAPAGTRDLGIQVSYDRGQLAVDDMVGVHVELAYHQPGAAQWIIVDLGVPPGFSVLAEDLDALVEQSASLATRIKRYELTGRSVILYLENVGGTVRFNYRMKARLVVRAQVPASSVYDYYNPATRDTQTPATIQVVE
jgi:5-hydroxyisourate hydrolase-like protein (transthyretin family)